MIDDGGRVDGIVAIMRGRWDLPADCNEGELFAYAEHLLNRLRAGDPPAALSAWLAAVQTDKLDMPASNAAADIVAQAAALLDSSRA
jgi:hypothetical protein